MRGSSSGVPQRRPRLASVQPWAHKTAGRQDIQLCIYDARTAQEEGGKVIMPLSSTSQLGATHAQLSWPTPTQQMVKHAQTRGFGP